MENSLFAEIDQFLRMQVQPEKVVLIASSDRYIISKAKNVLIVEDKHLQITQFLPIIGDLGE
jgi:hypothetical protein